MFSPYYFAARKKGPARAEEHCAINVCLYGQGPRRWAMTERGAARLSRGTDHFTLGPSRLRWSEGALTIDIDETAAPLPRRVRGQVRLRPLCQPERAFALDADGRHVWRPIAPAAHVEVELDAPALRWRGTGYFDANRGERPLEEDFASWHWSRSADESGARILYDGVRRDGTPFSLALDIGADGAVSPFAAPPASRLPGTFWRIDRRTRCDAGTAPQVLACLEDTPFYARSLIRSAVGRRAGAAFHESLSLDRFRHWLVQGMLPFRMPRRP